MFVCVCMSCRLRQRFFRRSRHRTHTHKFLRLFGCLSLGKPPTLRVVKDLNGDSTLIPTCAPCTHTYTCIRKHIEIDQDREDKLYQLIVLPLLFARARRTTNGRTESLYHIRIYCTIYVRVLCLCVASDEFIVMYTFQTSQKQRQYTHSHTHTHKYGGRHVRRTHSSSWSSDVIRACKPDRINQRAV